MPGTIELVGPKGYTHGWRYVGGPGLPGRAAHTRLSGVESRQRRSGLWGNRTAAGHEAEVSRLSPARKAIYNRLQTSGMSLPAALAYAKRGRMPLPRPPAGMNTPNMRFAIRAGLLAANNRLGRPDRQTIQAANDHPNLMELAMPTTQPIRTPSDLLISRGDGGVAIIRHRMGGAEIGQIRRDGGGWRASIGGKDLDPRTHQRTALADVIGTHNRGALTPQHRPSAGAALQPPPQQTPLMAQFGIPAIRALATPTAGAGDGPRTASNDSDSDDSSGNGLSAKGQQIYKKLKARGFPEARAMAFAKRAQNMGGGK